MSGLGPADVAHLATLRRLETRCRDLAVAYVALAVAYGQMGVLLFDGWLVVLPALAAGLFAWAAWWQLRWRRLVRDVIALIETTHTNQPRL